MRFIFKSLIFGVKTWGIALKVSLVLAILGVVLLIRGSKRRNLVCKACGNHVGASAKCCSKCGVALTDESTANTVGMSNKVKVIGSITTAIMLCVFGVSLFALTQNITIGNLATGVYSGYHQLYVQNENMWGVECDSALSDGSFRHLIEAGNIPNSIDVNSSSSSGTLILNVKQNGTTESYEISNTNGEQQLNLSWLEQGYDVQLSVEHTLVKDIYFVLSWV